MAKIIIEAENVLVTDALKMYLYMIFAKQGLKVMVTEPVKNPASIEQLKKVELTIKAK
jgi:hypothetical protein